jgi:hypothetical protein
MIYILCFFTNSNIFSIFAKRRFLDRLTVWRLAKVAIFTTKVDAENQTLINYKSVCGALKRHFCQTRVKGWLIP